MLGSVVIKRPATLVALPINILKAHHLVRQLWLRSSQRSQRNKYARTALRFALIIGQTRRVGLYLFKLRSFFLTRRTRFFVRYYFLVNVFHKYYYSHPD